MLEGEKEEEEGEFGSTRIFFESIETGDAAKLGAWEEVGLY